MEVEDQDSLLGEENGITEASDVTTLIWASNQNRRSDLVRSCVALRLDNVKELRVHFLCLGNACFATDWKMTIHTP